MAVRAGDVATDATQEASAPRRRAWVSRGFEVLIHELGSKPRQSVDFDVVIVGSGYGAAVAADRLAGFETAERRPLTVCMLERGSEYLPGAFPGRLADVGAHLRFTTEAQRGAKGRLEGLLDLRWGNDVSVLLANGVGGGSLINAGVMEFPSKKVFDDAAWPGELRNEYDALRRRSRELQSELGAADAQGKPNCIDDTTFGKPLLRQQAMQRLANGGTFRAVPISVALTNDHVTSGQVALEKCIACGDCATGCNYSAKDSLDVNLLRRAQLRGVRIYSGATVSRLAKHAAGGWAIETWHTDKTLRARMAGPFTVSAQRVILAAGALGSTEILLRSRGEGLGFSDLLGRRFSANADVLAGLFDAKQLLMGVAREEVSQRARHLGPTITGMIDRRDEQTGEGFVVQDLGVPAPLRRLFEEATATSSLMHRLDQADPDEHRPDDSGADPCAVDPKKVDRSMTIAIIGRDTAAGVITAIENKDPELFEDPGVRIEWKSARDDPRLDGYHSDVADLARDSGLGGEVLPNPMWRLLPTGVAEMLGARRGSLLTVHPLGGCPMGERRAHGVVNARGEVFDGDPRQPFDKVHVGLVVLDGSIVPTSLGINPALTIATLADRAARELALGWEFVAADTPIPDAQLARPIFRVPPEPRPPQPTEVQLIERLSGKVHLAGNLRWVELSLIYRRTPLPPQEPSRTMQGEVLVVEPDTQLSRVRVFEQAGTKFPEHERPDSEALFVAPLGGTLRFFHRERSTMRQRRRRAWCAWLKNRGARDSLQALVERISGAGSGRLSIGERWRQSRDLATRAGEVRRFDYRLVLGEPMHVHGDDPALRGVAAGALLEGHKRLTYERRASPFAQLMRIELTEFAGLALGEARQLEIDPFYFAKKGIPMLRLVAQQDQPNALADQASFLLYIARVLINGHLWSFRKPDRAAAREAVRLPGHVPGLPAPQIHEFSPANAAEGRLRLTRYPKPGATRRPVLMIHGYSASGTTFAHETVAPNLASHLWHHGIEPWIVDLRSSCGMPTATAEWSFEQIALADIPAAVSFVSAATGADKIDVVSHCMGSAMFALAALAPVQRKYQVEQHVERWVMSQAGPAMLFTPANVLRAYLIRYFRHLLPNLSYSLRPGGEAPGLDGDMYDRLLAALPYLEGEFEIENPCWLRPWKRTPWVGTRHRLDALIGRTFDARRMSPRTLEHIDDFFGPMNLMTISQPIHFARRAWVTDRHGMAWGAGDPGLLRQRLGALRMLSLHAVDNGLLDVETADELEKRLLQAKLRFIARRLPGHGHQDCLIGKDCTQVFELIDKFLDGAHDGEFPGP